MFKRMRNQLRKDRNGYSIFEWTLVLPFTVIIGALVLFTSVLLLSWANYGAVASNIAKDLNFRQTGLTAASTWVKSRSSASVVLSGTSAYDGKEDEKQYINWSQIYLNGKQGGAYGGDKYIQAVGYHMNEYKNQFFFTFTQIDKIEVQVKRLSSNGTSWENSDNLDTTKNMSGNIVKVDISYRFNPIQLMPANAEYNDGYQGVRWDGVGLVATGYGVIT